MENNERGYEVDVFYNSCLRKICNIYWPNKIRNVELHKKTDSMNMSLEIKNHRLHWLGHVLRMPEDNTQSCHEMDPI